MDVKIKEKQNGKQKKSNIFCLKKFFFLLKGKLLIDNWAENKIFFIFDAQFKSIELLENNTRNPLATFYLFKDVCKSVLILQNHDLTYKANISKLPIYFLVSNFFK